MYGIGTLVLYDKGGVYKVESVGTPPVQGVTGEYYKLSAVFSNSNETLYTPVSAFSFMRPLISGEEAAHYLEQFSQLEPDVFHSAKTMELTAHYQSMIASHRVEDCLILIKEIQRRQRELLQKRKRLGQVDTRYLKLAEKLVCEEFAAVLNTTPDLIRARLYGAA